jgi:uncharacterized membrane protein
MHATSIQSIAKRRCQRRPGRRAHAAGLRGLIAIFSMTGTLALAAPAAHAGSNVWCWGVVKASGADCATGDQHSLRRSYGVNYYGDQNFLEAASAYNGSGQYGSWAYANGSACHSYAGTTLLYPWIYNPDAGTQTLGGIEYWGSETPCP